MAAQLDPARADAVVAHLAAPQYGVVSRRQLIDAGVGRGAIAHRVRTGLLHRLHRGVFAVGYRRIPREGRWLAAVLAYGDEAAASHLTGLAVWELRHTDATRIHVSVTTRNGLAQRDGIRLHRLGSLTPAELTTRRGIRVTTVARTLLDSAALLSAPALNRTVERSEILELFDLTAMRRTLDLHPHHPGAKKLTAAIEVYREEEITRSDLEAILLERDRARDAKLTLAGYRVVRFTYRQILHTPRAVAATLGALLRHDRSMSSIR